MKISKMSSIGTLIVLTLFASAHAAPTQQNKMNMQDMCRNMSPDMQKFANQLTMNNKMLFCSKFSESQRKQAMQMVAQSGVNGKPKMTPDKSVEKIAADNKITTYEKLYRNT